MRRIVWSLWLIWLYVVRPDRFYDLMGIIRGPDPEINDLKWIFSARARYFLFRRLKDYDPAWRESGLSTSDIRDLAAVLDQMMKKRALDQRSFWHYCWHAVTSFAVLKEAPLLTRKERYEITALEALAQKFAESSISFSNWRSFDPYRLVMEWCAEWEIVSTRIVRQDTPEVWPKHVQFS